MRYGLRLQCKVRGLTYPHSLSEIVLWSAFRPSKGGRQELGGVSVREVIERGKGLFLKNHRIGRGHPGKLVQTLLKDQPRVFLTSVHPVTASRPPGMGSSSPPWVADSTAELLLL